MAASELMLCRIMDLFGMIHLRENRGTYSELAQDPFSSHSISGNASVVWRAFKLSEKSLSDRLPRAGNWELAGVVFGIMVQPSSQNSHTRSPRTQTNSQRSSDICVDCYSAVGIGLCVTVTWSGYSTILTTLVYGLYEFYMIAYKSIRSGRPCLGTSTH